MGRPFSLISLLPFQGFFGEAEGWMISLQSSKGGSFFFSDQSEMFFTGDEWSNITWLVINNVLENPWPQGYDNFVVSIPEPATLTLMGLALVGLALFRRRSLTIAAGTSQFPSLRSP